jgi:hypothetical protein
MFKLPTSDGESSTLWSHDDDDVPERLIVICHGGDRWTMASQIREGGDEWEDGPICIHRYSRSWTGLVLALNSRATVSAQFMRAMVKGRAAIPLNDKPIKFARMTGSAQWWVAWKFEGGNYHGEPMLSIEFSRPLDADEMITAIGQMCKAIDAWEKATET